MLKPAVSLAAAGCEIVVNPLGSGPVAGTLIASTICGAFLADGSVAAADPEADPVADRPAALRRAGMILVQQHDGGGARPRRR